MSTPFTMPALAEHLPAGSFEVAAVHRRDAHDHRAGASTLVEVSRALRDDPALRFVVCVDVTAADHFPREPRYDVVYHLVRRRPRLRLRMRVHAGGADTDGADGVGRLDGGELGRARGDRHVRHHLRRAPRSRRGS